MRDYSSPKKYIKLPVTKIVEIITDSSSTIFALDFYGALWRIKMKGNKISTESEFTCQLYANAPILRSFRESLGKIYGIGSNNTLWVSENENPSAKFKNVTEIKDIIQIECSLTTFVNILCQDGTVFCIKQFTFLDELNANSFKKIIFDDDPSIKIIRLASTYTLHLYLSSNGIIYSCGKNRQGELSFGHFCKIISPIRNFSLPFIKNMFCVCISCYYVDFENFLWYSSYDGFPKRVCNLEGIELYSAIFIDIFKAKDGKTYLLKGKLIELENNVNNCPVDDLITKTALFQKEINKNSYVSHFISLNYRKFYNLIFVG